MEKNNYYKDQLHSEKLCGVYDTSILRVRQYLEAEIEFVIKRLKGTESILELGAGYGRIIKELSSYAGEIVGIDISESTVSYGRKYLGKIENARLEAMDAYTLHYSEKFDIALCLQNGLSAIRGNRRKLVDVTIKAIKKDGTAYFSTYSDKFWDHRLAWFIEQSEKGLIGQIDFEKTGSGIISCYDGFKAYTLSKKELSDIGEETGYEYDIKEVDDSSLFLIITKR